MVNTADAYGAELWDYFKTKDDKREIVERDDNFIDGTRTGYGGDPEFKTVEREIKIVAPSSSEQIRKTQTRPLRAFFI